MFFRPKSRVDESTEKPATDSAAVPRPAAPAAHAVIASSVYVRGEIVADSDLLLEGKVDADVTVEGRTLTVGPDARVIGALHAASIVVHGEVRGALSATDRIEVTTTGVVKGLIHASRFVLADGGVMWGTVNRQPDAVSSQKPGPHPAFRRWRDRLERLRACG